MGNYFSLLQLRNRKPAVKVSWFLHTPFPTSEVYRILPVRKELLEGLLQADLIGFQVRYGLSYFISTEPTNVSCRRMITHGTSFQHVRDFLRSKLPRQGLL